jgi:hypothetical protein
VRKTPEQAQELKKEIQAWMTENRLTDDTGWRSADEAYGEQHLSFPFPHYWVLWFEGDLYNVIWGYPLEEPHDRSSTQLKEELREIFKRHDCWYEPINNTSISIMGRAEA